MRTSRSFPPVAPSIPAARQFVLDTAGTVGSGLRDAIAVMVSELAMNAVEHARTAFTVTTQLTGTTLRVEVTDSAAGTPEARPLPPALSLRGRGLYLVGQFADTWGTLPSRAGTGKTVWFQITLAPPAQPHP